jgi:three-Cys-motif partner protein
MLVCNLHQRPYDQATRDKLELYREYLREWLPVFISGASVDILQIFDFFAGPVFDEGGNPGSPVITCDEIRNATIQTGKKRSKIIKVYLMKSLHQNSLSLSFRCP